MISEKIFCSDLKKENKSLQTSIQNHQNEPQNKLNKKVLNKKEENNDKKDPMFDSEGKVTYIEIFYPFL